MVDGVVDYATVPTGVVSLLRVDSETSVRLAGDDVSRQRRLTLPVGRYVFVIERGERQREVPVDVVAGVTVSLDAAR